MENAKKYIDFIITQKCTYKCSYCLQSKAQAKCQNHADINTINAFYELLDNLEKDFEITITGGEALLHPDFFEIIRMVKHKGFKINLITNLSFKIEQYQHVFDFLGESLNKYDISFHLDEIQNFNLMIEKLEKFLQIKPETTQTTFFIPLYKINDKKERKIDKLLRIAKKHNIEYEFQKIRFLNKYKKIHSEKYISNQKSYKTFARLCSAGKTSAVIYEDGNAYRCYSSRFLKSNHLGNIKDKNFKLNYCKTPCPSLICSCPKPAKYRQIHKKRDFKTAFTNTLYNAIFLPELIIKNRQIIKQKIMQLIKTN